MADGLPRRRVVVTGMGTVSAAGWGVPPLARALDDARSAIGGFARFDHARYRTHVAGEVPGEPAADFAPPPDWPRLSYADRFAVFAAAEALSEAGLHAPLGEAGVYFGTSTGGLFESEGYLE